MGAPSLAGNVKSGPLSPIAVNVSLPLLGHRKNTDEIFVPHKFTMWNLQTPLFRSTLGMHIQQKVSD